MASYGVRNQNVVNDFAPRVTSPTKFCI